MLLEEESDLLRTTAFNVLVLLTSVSVGFLVFGLTNMYCIASTSKDPYSYAVYFYDDVRTKDLGVTLNVNLSNSAAVWFVSDEKNVVLDISAEKASSLVQNFSWRIFGIELDTIKDGHWHLVGVGHIFLNRSEWSDSYLYRHLNVSVDTVNMKYFESVGKAWFTVWINMNVCYNNTEYSFDFYTLREIGPVLVLSPIYSPISLAIVSSATTATCAVLLHQVLSQQSVFRFKKRPFLKIEN